jgi:hypothetical protein
MEWASRRYEVLMAMKMSLLIFWVVTPCGLVGSTNVSIFMAVCSSETLVSSRLKMEAVCSSETSVAV